MKIFKESKIVSQHRFTYRGIKFFIKFSDDNTIQITQIRAYDDAEYSWALSKDGGESFSIYRDGKFIEQYAPVTFEEDEEDGIWDEVAGELLRLDADVKPRMMYN